VLWPNAIESAVGSFGWQRTMLWLGLATALAILPLTLLLRQAPVVVELSAGGGPAGSLVLGLRPNVAMALIVGAIFLCCIPMAMPQGHLVAFCSDVGIPATRGAAMLSLMLGAAFISRQFWGWMADRMGGLRTVLAASTVQAVALAGFLLTQDEAGLFAVSAAFGMGFSGIVPAYVVALRELFPDREAGWRVPILLLMGQVGMAAGGWLAAAIYDASAAYMPAFAAGVAFNIVNLMLLSALLWRAPPRRPALAPA
jgi:predicted MFS family arabinose efflux permease